MLIMPLNLMKFSNKVMLMCKNFDVIKKQLNLIKEYNLKKYSSIFKSQSHKFKQ